jgi:hypothetical protein
MSGASSRSTKADAKRSSSPAGSATSSTATKLDLERIAPLHASALIATFHRDAPARCGAFGDERRVVVGEKGGRVYTWVDDSSASGAAQRRPDVFGASPGNYCSSELLRLQLMLGHRQPGPFPPTRSAVPMLAG